MQDCWWSSRLWKGDDSKRMSEIKGALLPCRHNEAATWAAAPEELWNLAEPWNKRAGALPIRYFINFLVLTCVREDWRSGGLHDTSSSWSIFSCHIFKGASSYKTIWRRVSAFSRRQNWHRGTPVILRFCLAITLLPNSKSTFDGRRCEMKKDTVYRKGGWGGGQCWGVGEERTRERLD